MSEEIIVLNLETKTGPIQYNLIRLKHGNEFCWKERSLFEDIIIYTNLNNEWKSIKKFDRIITKNNDIKKMFLKEHEKLSEEGFESDDDEPNLLFPYDPEQIRIASKNFSIFQV